MCSKIGIAVCTLNQLALDFEGNLARILRSLDECVQAKASIRIGPELEITGYSCEDAFFEEDTVFHSWQVLARILECKQYENILIDIGKFSLKLVNLKVLLLFLLLCFMKSTQIATLIDFLLCFIIRFLTYTRTITNRHLITHKSNCCSFLLVAQVCQLAKIHRYTIVEYYC